MLIISVLLFKEIVTDGVIYYGHTVGHFTQKNAIYMASV